MGCGCQGKSIKIKKYTPVKHRPPKVSAKKATALSKQMSRAATKKALAKVAKQQKGGKCVGCPNIGKSGSVNGRVYVNGRTDGNPNKNKDYSPSIWEYVTGQDN